MKISIIGSGVVGKATGVGFSMYGNEVLFYDINKEKLALLRRHGYEVAESITEAVCNSTVLFICVQTPTVNGQMDFITIKRAAIDIAQVLRKRGEYHVIVVRSTVLPFTTRTMIVPLLEQHSQLKSGKDFGVCMNPEFLRQASALQDFLNPSRIVIGELDRQSGDLLEKLYAPFKATVFRTNLDTAEMIKYVANLFLATKISFFNEIYIVCKELGLSPHFISEVVSLDPRIGRYGIHGGRPFGGDCLPKDLEAFISFVKSKGLNPKILSAVFNKNKEMTKTMREKRH